MSAPTTQPRRRFVPVPIETTFEQYRKTGPAAELTPSPSPRSPSPRSPSPPPLPLKEKRRFAPQLVESSVRRSRRAGDEGPATRPTDRTDITPYTNHIYAPRSKKRHGNNADPASRRRTGHARRESCDDEIANDYFDLVARDAQRKLQEVAMSAFPNSGQRIGGAEHFYVREGSDDESIQSRGRSTRRFTGGPRLSRRNSSEEDIGWAFKEMQEHAQVLGVDKERVSTLDLDNMSIDSPPSDAMGLTRAARQSLSSSPLWSARPPSGSLGPIGEAHMPFVRAESPLPTIGESVMQITPESPSVRPIGESHMPYIPSAPSGKAAQLPYAPASQIPVETGFHNHVSPFRRFGVDKETSLERARKLHHLKSASPPMLGKELVFRMSPSPQQTKLEPVHLWDLESTTADEACRDTTEEKGLWRGYCYTSQDEMLAPTSRPALIHTPHPLGSPGDPFSQAFAMSMSAPLGVSEEPSPDENTTRAVSAGLYPEHRARNQERKGLHMLQGLEERLRKEKVAADLEEQILAEFDDAFVTQVYNYLSLGYPAMARPFDDELSKISRITMEDLEQDDEAITASLWGPRGAEVEMTGVDGETPSAPRARRRATGYILVDAEEKQGLSEEERCPRWRALKLYIYEWARQHPDLQSFSPLTWGVRERRGSWGV